MLSENKIRIRNITILLGSSMTILAAAMLAPALPAMSQAFQDEPNVDLLVRLVLTVPALMIAIGAPFSGLLLDRWGRKPVLVTALILYGFAGASGFVLQTLHGIIVGRLLLGLAVAGIMSGFTTLIGDYFSGQRLNQFMGYQASVMAFGGVLFLLAGGFLADIGWRFPFLMYLFSFFILIGVIYAVNEPNIKSKAVEEIGSEIPAEFPWRIAGLIYLIAFVSMMLFYIVPVQLPFYLTEASNISNGQVGLAMSLQALVAAIVSLRFQRIRSRFSSWTITMLVFLTLGIGNVLIGLFTSYALVVLGLLIAGSGLGLLMPNLNVWLVSVIPASVRGRAVGGLTMSLFLGQFLSPFATQPVVEQFDLAAAFVGAGIASLLLALVFVVAARSVSVRTAVAG